MIRDARNHTNFIAFRTGKTYRPFVLLFVGLGWILGPTAAVVKGQSALNSIGIPQLRSEIPVPSGSVDASSGKLHLEIPISTSPQRGLPPQLLKLVYDSNYYVESGATWWGPDSSTPLFSFSTYLTGWRLVADNYSNGVGSDFYAEETCGYDDSDLVDEFDDWFWQSPDGAGHTFSTVNTKLGYDDPFCGDYTSSSDLIEFLYHGA